MGKSGPGVGPGFGSGSAKIDITEFSKFFELGKEFSDWVINSLGVGGFEGDFDPEEEETWLIEDGHYPIAGDKWLDKQRE
jgi:hypothetical protein